MAKRKARRSGNTKAAQERAWRYGKLGAASEVRVILASPAEPPKPAQAVAEKTAAAKRSRYSRPFRRKSYLDREFEAIMDERSEPI